ncbi:unnamed protein product [Alopecurus aequalis]
METAVTVMQLVWTTSKLILKIIQAAEVPSQNKVECDDIAGRLSVLGKLLTRLQLRCPEAAEELARLHDTLDDAHDLVVASQKSSVPMRFVMAGVHAERFSKVNRRIDSHLNVLHLCCHIDTTDCLEQIIANTSAAALPTATTTAMVAADADDYEVPSRGSCSRSVQPDMCVIVPYSSPKISTMSSAMTARERCTNGTLSDHLHGGGGEASPVMSSWKARVKALLGAARAIDHLHRVAAPPVIHRNISSSSILLDESWAPRVSDFGSAVLQAPMAGEAEEHGQGQVVAEVVGTSGYIDPEYRRTKRVSPASDVYSFGVVMLEVLTGRPPVATGWEEDDPMTLFGSAVPIIESGDLGSLLDDRPSQRQMEALELVACMAARCLWMQDRPDMSNVVTELDKALGLIEISDEPAA